MNDQNCVYMQPEKTIIFTFTLNLILTDYLKQAKHMIFRPVMFVPFCAFCCILSKIKIGTEILK